MKSKFAKMYKIITAIVATSSILYGCGEKSIKSSVESSALIQDDICLAKSSNQASNCKAGQKVVFLPNSWGNEQLPIIFSAVNCDLRYSVVMNNGGVTCIYVGEKKLTEKEQSPANEKTK